MVAKTETAPTAETKAKPRSTAAKPAAATKAATTKKATTARKTASKTRSTQSSYLCQVCGLAVSVDEWGDTEFRELICCDKIMKPRARKAAPARKTVAKK